MKKNTESEGGISQTLILTAAVLLTAGLVIGLVFKVNDLQKQPVYDSVSMSEEAAARAYIWLSQIEDMPLSYAQIKEMMGDIRLTVILTPTQEKEIYTQTLDQESYADCLMRAQSGFGRAYREVAAHRLQDAGYSGEITDAVLDDIMQEAYGVSVAEYLTACGVQLLPPLEELSGRYSGQVRVEKNRISPVRDTSAVVTMEGAK